MNIYKFYITVCSFLTINLYCGYSGKEEQTDITLNLYNIVTNSGDAVKYFVKYTDETNLYNIHENFNKDLVENKFYLVKCDNNDYFNDLILLACNVDSIDDKEKTVYKILYLKDYTLSKDSNNINEDYKISDYKRINFFDIDKDNKYTLSEIGEEYFLKIKEKKTKDILTKNNIKGIKKTDGKSEEDIKEKDASRVDKTIEVKIPKRLFKSK